MTGNFASGRGVTAVLGPTNTGKTHLAIERMLGHESGLIGLPLRLLAREVYDRMVARVGAAQVALITGEEKIKPKRPRYYVCTVEAMPRDLDVDFEAVDEVQLAGDPERGHVFTDRILHCRSRKETLLLGAATMRETLAHLLPQANFITRPRLSQLTYAGQKKLTRLPRRSAIVAFAADDVYAIAELIRRQRGGAAVVLGALSPRTRNAQVGLYESGEVDFLVATDAIGMGLNLDLDHVAFAAARKFDGQRNRDLTPAEIGQIAGRAGRHMNDGTFGVTGSLPPFSPELIERLEAHEFEPVRTLQWRNRDLDFSSIKALMASLQEPPHREGLAKVRMTNDVLALEALCKDSGIGAMAATPQAVHRLWDVCRLPDYRKISAANHAELIGTLYRSLMSGNGHIDEDWYAREVEFANRDDGDIDTLANRIAHIRTWTYLANRRDWLADPDHWQARTRAIEDMLSDALHEKLTQRFVDRRTGVLMKRLRDEEEVYGEVSATGEVMVENHFTGHLDGFRFTPDTEAQGIHGKAVRAAAMTIVGEEIMERSERLVAAQEDAFSLSPESEIVWEGASIARLVAGEDPFRPGLTLLADDVLQAAAREQVQLRLETWLKAHISSLLKPLCDLDKAEDITGLARGIAFRLRESLGVLRREEAADDIRALDQPARKQLRRYGVRFGAFNVYFPALLKPAPVRLTLLLWTLRRQGEAGGAPAAVPVPPGEGLTSAAADRSQDENFYRISGFQVCGQRAVRIDMLERLADMIRPILAFRGAKDTGTAPPDGYVEGGGFRIVPDMMSLVGCSGEEFESILESLGFSKSRRRKPQPEGPAEESAKAGQEDSREEKPAAGQPAAADKDPAHEPAPAEAVSGDDPSSTEAPAEEDPFEDIWFPRRKGHGQSPPRRKDVKPRRAAGKDKRPARKKDAKGSRGKRKDGAHAARPKRQPAPRPAPPDPDSPFAALGALKDALERGKGPNGG